MAGTENLSASTQVEQMSDDDLVRQNLPLVGYLVAATASTLPDNIQSADLP